MFCQILKFYSEFYFLENKKVYQPRNYNILYYAQNISYKLQVIVLLYLL